MFRRAKTDSGVGQTDVSFGSRRTLMPALLALMTTTALTGAALAQVRGAVGQSTERIYDPAADSKGIRGSTTSGSDADTADSRAKSKTSGAGAAAELGSNTVVNINTKALVRKRTRAMSGLTRPPNRVVRAPSRTAATVGGIAPPVPLPRGAPDIVAPGFTEPMRPLKKKKKADDPYAPLGLRLGGITVNAGVDVQAGFDSNALRTGAGVKRESSMFYQVAPDLTLMSDWSRHQLQMDLKGAYLLYPDVADASRPTFDGKLTFRGDVARDTTVNLELKEKIETQRPGSLDLSNAVKGRPAYYTHSGMAGVTQKFGAASVTAAANVDRTTYDDGVTYAGRIYDQKDRAYSSYGVRLRGAYEITPGIVPYAEVSADTRQYDQAVDKSGYRRSSQGLIGRAGTTFEVSQQLTGEVAVGYGARSYDDTRLDPLTGALVDASMVWQMSPLTKMTLKGTSEFQETTATGSSGAVNRKLSVDVSHDLLRNLTVTGSLAYGHALYQGNSRMEQTIASGLKFDYKIDRTFIVRGSYGYERSISEMPGQGYLAHVFLLGLRVQR